MVQGSWLMPQGSWLKVHGSWPKEFGARAWACRTQRQICLGQYTWPFEPWGHEPWGSEVPHLVILFVGPGA